MLQRSGKMEEIKERSIIALGSGAIPQIFWAKVESNFDVLLVTGEDKS